MKRFASRASPPSPPRMNLDDEQYLLLRCTEKMPVFQQPGKENMETEQPQPANLKRRRVLPRMFLQPPTPEKSSDSESEEENEKEAALRRMILAREIVFADIEDREAERMRETADYLEGDTPHTSQESKLSDYMWSCREGGDTVPLNDIVNFIIEYVPRPKLYNRVMPFACITEEMYERDPDRAMELIAHVLDCEPVVLLNTLEDAIEEAEKQLHQED